MPTEQAGSTAVAPPTREQSKPLREVAKIGELFTNGEFMRRIGHAVPKVITPTMFLSSFASSVRKSPLLMECSVADVAGKALFLAQAGLQPDTPLQHAHLIPFKENRWNPETKKREPHYVCQVVIGYHGLLDLAYRGGKVAAVNAAVAWRDEVDARMFQYERGSEEYLRHVLSEREHNLSAEAQAAGTADFPAFAYAIAGLNDSKVRPFEVWPWHKVQSIRNSTPAYSFAMFALEEAKKQGGRLPPAFMKAPWVAFTEKMTMKTMVRQLLNYLPRSVEYASIAALDEAQERRPIDFGPIIEGRAEQQDYVAAATDAAEDTGDPGATFGTREPEPPTQTRQDAPQRQPTQRQAQAPKPSPASPPPAQRAAEPAPRAAAEPQGDPRDEIPLVGAEAPASDFQSYLFDEVGDYADDLFTDPVKFAEAFEAMMRGASDRATFLENNEDGIAMAIEASGEARAILERATAEPEQASAPASRPSPEVVLVEERGRKDWKGFLADCKNVLEQLEASQLADFAAKHKPKMADGPPAQRIQFVQVVSERAKALQVAMPAGVSDLLPNQKPPAPQGTMQVDPAEQSQEQHLEADTRQVDAFVKELADLTTTAQIAQWRSKPYTAKSIERLERETPSQYDRLQTAISNRMAAVARG